MANIRISRTILLGVAALMLLLLPSPAAARVHVGVGFGFWGPVYPYPYWGAYPAYYSAYPAYGYPAYGYGYGPGYGYGSGYGYGYGRPMGEVKLKSAEPNAEIYINGSLAGRAHNLKHFYLRPGTYTIEQRYGGDVQSERVYVLAHRTIKLEFGPVTSGHDHDRDYDHDYDRDHHRQHYDDHDRDDY